LGCRQLDSADTGTFFDGKFDVSFFTPLVCPGVLDNVVRSTLFDSPSNTEDTVVKSGSAFGTLDDTSGILVENRFVGFNCNRDWSNGEGSLHLVSTLLFDISVRCDLDSTLLLVVLASEETGRGFIWVVFLSLKCMGFGVFESKVHQTTTASMVQP